MNVIHIQTEQHMKAQRLHERGKLVTGEMNQNAGEFEQL